MDDTHPNVYDKAQNLLKTLGSFWAETYGGRQQVLAYVAATCDREQQTMLDVAELIACVSRFNVPIFHRTRWALLPMLLSDRNGAKTNIPRYDDGGVYDGRTAYDEPQPHAGFAFPLPPDFVAAQTAVNRFLGATLLWTAGVDFRIDLDRRAIVFEVDPFSDPRVAKRAVYNDLGAVVDQEAALWLFNADFDFETIYLQFGYAVDLQMASSRGYRTLMNAVYDALVGGGVGLDFDRALSAITGVPLVLEAEEVVQAIAKQRDELLICTDLHVYKFADCAAPLVEIGDVVHMGDQLTDAVRLDSFNRGETPADLAALAVGKGFLATCFFGDLVFENREFPLTVDAAHPSGFTKVSFPLGGMPADVTRFFDDVHAAGIAAAQVVDECYTGRVVIYPPLDCDEVEVRRKRATLAQLLDVREQPVGEPTAASLPTKVNPLQFLIRNIYRNNVFLVRIKANLLGRDALGMHQLRLLRRMIPRSQAAVFLIEISPTVEEIKAEQITETIGTFVALTTAQDEIHASKILDSRAALQSIPFTCR